MTAPAGRPPEPPLEDLPPDAPATVEDVRAARRWTMVALAWAIAASAIALFALLGQDEDDPAPAPADNATPRIQRLERETEQRLDAFERRIENRAAQDDIQKLERRLESAEDDASEAKTAADRASTANGEQGDRLDDHEQRIEELENRENQPGGAGDEAAP